jgi:catechol 2,3-dioxygenase-like lactoylglutathione lyase family enzyme
LPIKETPERASFFILNDKGEKMSTKLAVVSIWAEDVSATAHFYRDVVELLLLEHHGDIPHFDLNGVYLTILKGRPIPVKDAVPARFPLLAFAVDNLDAAVVRLNVHRVELPWGIEKDGVSRWVMFHDPAGNLIELVQFE